MAKLSGLLATTDPDLGALAAAARDLRAAGVPALAVEGPAALRPFLAALLAGGSTVLAVTATDREAEDLGAAAADLLGRDAVAVLPSWETLPHERLSPRPDTVGRRLAIFRALADPATAPAARRGRRAQPDPADRARPGPAGPGDAAGRRRARLRRPAGPARRAGLHARRDGHRPRRVRRARRHRRRLPARRPSTRSASSSGATRSASCAASRSRTSGRSPPSTCCTPPAAASCCSPPRSATGPLCSPARTRTTRPCASCWSTWPRASRSRGWSR